MPELKLYTTVQLREWLNKGYTNIDGLSQQIIAPSRAWAIVHNPYIEDTDTILAAIFIDNKPIAFTAAFPEIICNKKIWWLTTLYCEPKYRGKGYGLIVVGSLVEIYGAENILDRWGAPETIEIFKYFGAQTLYTTRYHLRDKIINNKTFKGKIAYIYQKIQKKWHNIHNKHNNANYVISYLPYIDDRTYEFIKEHTTQNIFCRSNDMLNWILHYPFFQENLLYTDSANNRFESIERRYAIYAIQILNINNDIIGIYLLRIKGQTMQILYLYYEENCQDIVFNSIKDHILAYNPIEFSTENHILIHYLQNNVYFPKYYEEKVSFSFHNDDIITSKISSHNFSFQFGDGDCFA